MTHAAVNPAAYRTGWEVPSPLPIRMLMLTTIRDALLRTPIRDGRQPPLDRPGWRFPVGR
jgi:hypothetical protein